ncbi:MAG: ABC transporter substrate-binding protein [Planctomycetota bacterium]|nr:ABC transporter substrate-binding protein [Planctomycetaceae bacterium]MDQ3329565.1 ABC transporter substrate-binding protein [Planctomycetota bacterium]
MPRWTILTPVLMSLLGCWQSDPEPAPATAHDGTLRKVTLQLNWYPEAEHGGFYAALENGYYRDEGLDVTILRGGADVPVVQKVAAGQADFGIENADRILLMRAQEADVVAVLAPMQTSPRCLMVHEIANVASFADLKGVTIAMNAGEPFAQFLLKKSLPNDVQVVPYTGGVSHFLRDDKHAQQGYSFSEPFLAEEQGTDPKVLLVAEAGFNPYTSCLFTRDELADEEPSLVRKMVSASVKGWKDYLASPNATNAAIHNLNPEMSLDILAFGAEAMRPLCSPEGQESQPFGRMTAERWQNLAQQMIDTGVLEPKTVDPAKAFRAEFLPSDSPE